MKTYVVVLCAATIFGLTTITLDARMVPSSVHEDVVMDEASADFNSTNGDASDHHAVPIPRQEDEERPFEYVPRVFHSLRKIIKGVLNGSIHEIFHGSFSFAPRDISNEIIGVYNQVVGLPDPTTPGYNATLEKLLEEDGLFEEEEEEAFRLK